MSLGNIVVQMEAKYQSDQIKLREPIRFENKLTDGRTTDVSASDKLRWLGQ